VDWVVVPDESEEVRGLTGVDGLEELVPVTLDHLNVGARERERLARATDELEDGDEVRVAPLDVVHNKLRKGRGESKRGIELERLRADVL
jgi:hypothetical protein